MTSLKNTFEKNADPAQAFLASGLKHSFDLANHGTMDIATPAVETTAAPAAKPRALDNI